MTKTTKMKRVKAWAITRRGKIPDNDYPQFMCIFSKIQNAKDAMTKGDWIFPCTITYTLPAKK